MKKWKILAVIQYFVPLLLVVFIKLFTKLGQDIENCIFAFFVGLVVQCIISIWGLIRIRKDAAMNKERILFVIGVVPLFLLFLLFLASRNYH